VELRTIMFDLGGTLVSPGGLSDERRAQEGRQLMKAAGLEGIEPMVVGAAIQKGMARAVDEVCSAPFYRQCDLLALGYRYGTDSVGGALSSEDALGLARDALQAAIQDGRLREGAVSTLDQLRRSDFVLGVVSNIEENDLSMALEVHGLRPHFDFVLSSEAAGSCKPHERIFQQSILKSGHPAALSLFVGDTPAHDIDGAAVAGMRTVLIQADWDFATRNVEAQHAPDHVIAELPELLGIVS